MRREERTRRPRRGARAWTGVEAATARVVLLLAAACPAGPQTAPKARRAGAAAAAAGITCAGVAPLRRVLAARSVCIPCSGARSPCVRQRSVCRPRGAAPGTCEAAANEPSAAAEHLLVLLLAKLRLRRLPRLAALICADARPAAAAAAHAEACTAAPSPRVSRVDIADWWCFVSAASEASASSQSLSCCER